MNKQEYINYTRITEAIAFIQQNFTEQPTLEKIAEKDNSSLFHFQKCLQFGHALLLLNITNV